MFDFSIGDLSRRTGVKVPTIRYYEDAGLLPVPSRSVGKQRRYDSTAVARLTFIRNTRKLGFDTPSVRELLTLSEEPDRSCVEVDRIARHHVEAIDRRIAQLSALRRELRRALDGCGHGRVGDCWVVEALSDAE